VISPSLFKRHYSGPLNLQAFPSVLRVAKHEAGHYIAGRVLGFRSDGFAVTFSDPSGESYSGTAGIFLNANLPTVESIADYAERRVQVLFAGVFAESLRQGTGRVDAEKAADYLQKGGASDFGKAREQMQLLLSLRHGRLDDERGSDSLIQAINDELWLKARLLVEEEHEFIEGIAMNLAQRVKDIGVEYRMEEADISALPRIRERFGLAEAQPAEKAAAGG